MTLTRILNHRVLCSLCLLYCTLHPHQQIQAETEKPNVLFISVDDLNDWAGYLGGHPNAKTPNIDRLAQSGSAFTNTYCAAPACGPSRAALMTGVLPSNSGVYFNQDDWRVAPRLKGIKTIPESFRDNGYKTLGSGKIFHGPHFDIERWDEYWPEDRQTPKDRNRPPKELKHKMGGQAAKGNFNWGPTKNSIEKMGDFQVTEYVCSALKKDHHKPFFLGCGIFRPHLPWFVPKEYFDRFPLNEIKLPKVLENDTDDLPPAAFEFIGDYGPSSDKGKNDDHPRLLKHGKWKHAVQAYLACIAFADDCVGRVLDTLKNSKYHDNTIVILWSDHGWNLGEKTHWRKFALWEDTARCNLILKMPGQSKGQSIKAPVGLIDIFPTLLDLCGLPANKNNDGLSLKALMENPNTSWQRPALTTYGKNTHALRSKKWRYIHYEKGDEELYNHETDPSEWTNLASNPEYTSVLKKMRDMLPKTNVDRMPHRKK
ncbi:MAG: sulfatase [Planctomycetes bacterium]|nr:sulfatase [Planctomycetota bacterium]